MTDISKDNNSSGTGAAGSGSGGDGSPFPLPRVTIKFCTQCKWMLRAAYYAQELLSTFSTSLGEVALQPSTGGTFVVEIFHPHSQTDTSSSSPSPSSNPTTTTTTSPPSIKSTLLWDRKTDGGFPETKELKRRVRDVIEPGRNLGHVDRDHARPTATSTTPTTTTKPASSSAGGGEVRKDEPTPSSSAAPLPPPTATATAKPGEEEEGKAECEDCK